MGASGSLSIYTITNLTTTALTAGDVLPGGYLFMFAASTSPSATNYYVVDVNSSHSNYLKLVNPGSSYSTSGATDLNLSTPVDANDVAYNTTNQLLYGVISNNDGSNPNKIVMINPTNGSVAYGPTVSGGGFGNAPSGGSTPTYYGAVFFESSMNFLYVYDNVNGRLFKVVPSTGQAVQIFSGSTAATNNDGAACPNAPFGVTVTGNVYDDTNGLTDNTVNGTGTNAGGALYAVLYDNTNNIVSDTVQVNSNGTFSLDATTNTSYSIIITTNPPSFGGTSQPASSLPSGWVSTGEHLGSGSGSDGTVNGTLPLGTVTGNVSNANFGIVQCPNGLNVTASASPSSFCAANVSTVTLNSSASGGITSYSYSWSSASGITGSTTSQNTTTTPSGSGTYTITVTDGVGCTATASTTVTVNATPYVTATAAPTAICLGKTITLTGTADLTGSVIGSSGSYNGSGNTIANVFDANVSTYFDAPSANSQWAGLDFGSTKTLTSISYYPRGGEESRMVGGVFQGSTTVDFSSGVTTLYTISAQPPDAYTTVTVSGSYRYVRYLSPNNGYGNVAEVAFYGTTNPDTYVWGGTGGTSATINLTTATPTGTGSYSYTFKATDQNSCNNTATTNSVIVNANPTVTANTNKTLVCPGGLINLTSNPNGGTGGYTYAWGGSGTINTTASQNPTATPAATGKYTVTVTDGNNCTATATTGTVTYDNPVPSIALTCGTNSNGINYAQLNENSGIAVSWLWTTTNGGRFYTDNTLSVNNDATTSTQQATYIDYNGTYSVAITDANNCGGSGSTTLTSSSCNVILATSNLNFTVEKQNNAIMLDWSTSSETNNSYFNIERSADGIAWQVIGTVNGQGNNSILTKYNFTDALPFAGINYYRLKQVDANGQYSYSSVKYLVFTSQWLVKLYPNPVQNYLVLEFNNEKNENASIVLQNVLGNTVYAAQQQIATGLNRIILNHVQQLATGTYMLMISTTENIFRSKFVKSGK